MTWKNTIYGWLAVLVFIAGMLFATMTFAADYAIVIGGQVKEIRRNYTPPSDPDAIKTINGVPVLRQYIEIRPPFDEEIEVREGPTRVITDTTVTDTWTVRAKTPLELDGENTKRIDNIDIAVFRSLCHLKNEIRTRVQSLPAWSNEQCKSAFKGLLP